MVGTLFKMISSPNGYHLDEKKKSLLKSHADMGSGNYEDRKNNLKPEHKDDIKSEISMRNGGFVDHGEEGVYDDADGDIMEQRGPSFQCACKVWSCTQCQKAFSSARALKIHEVKQHENMPKQYIKCNHCDEVFDHGNLLQIHMKVHHNIKVYCSQCKELPKPINAKSTHTEPVCPVCGVKFDHDKLLKLHMEHYHKVTKKDSSPNEATSVSQQTALLSPNQKLTDSRSISPNSRKQTPSPSRLMEGGRFPRLRYDSNSDDSASRSSASPREAYFDHEAGDPRQMIDHRFNNDWYLNRPLLAVPPYLAMHNGPLPYGPIGYFPHGVRRSFEKRPLGRSQSLPLKQDIVYGDGHIIPWQYPDSGHHKMYGVSREKKLDRAALEAMRNSLKAKLRSVEETLLRNETDHHPASPTVHSLYDGQDFLGGREEDALQSHRPSVITPRNTLGFKRHAPPSDLEPAEKMHASDKASNSSLSPSRSPSRHGTSRSPQPKEVLIPKIYEPREASKASRDELSIPDLQKEYFDNQSKIFIKRGAPRCNRCQQTFCSKMEYLHHLISHKETDGLVDASPEEMEFIEGVKRSLGSKSFPTSEMIENHKKSSAKVLENYSPDKRFVDVESNDKDYLDSESLNSPDKNRNSVSPSATEKSNPSSQAIGTECVECKDVFADPASYQNHVEKRHMKPRCRECGLTFDHKNLLKIHMDCYHSSVEVLQCYYCGLSFKQRGAFLDHLTSHESQDISSKERAIEQSDTNEPGGRRRWGRLVASAQLPAERLDESDGDCSNPNLAVRNLIALKSQTKQKLRKVVSLSAYTDLKHLQKKSQAEYLKETRSKGDEVLGKEMRTRIFLPNIQDKMENLSRFATSSVQLAKKRVSPPPEEISLHRNGHYIFNQQAISTDQEDSRHQYYSEKSLASSRDTKTLPGQKRKLERSKRGIEVEDEVKEARLGFPLRKAFVRDEVENLYQMRHKKAFHSSDLTKSSADIDHRNALVKIERVEVDQTAGFGSSHELDYGATAQIHHGDKKGNAETSLIKAKQSQNETVAWRQKSSVRRTQSGKSNYGSNPSSPGEPTDRDSKPIRRNSIKKMTKEALINSLSLKRRSSAPDLYSLNQSQDELDEKNDKTDATSSSGGEKVETSSTEIKHNGAKSLYTPRKQSDRDATCIQCGLSFGHKKLYKIHLDSYHGKQSEHECLQCGVKNFRNKDEFVKHLMAHQIKDRAGDLQPSTNHLEGDFDRNIQNEYPVEFGGELNPQIRKLKVGNGSEYASSDDERLSMEHGNEHLKLDDCSRADIEVENVDKKTTCLLCCKVFQNGKQLEQHFSSHAVVTDDGRFCCRICNKSFETLRKLEVHSRSHTGFKPHKCEQCGRCFPYYSSYYYHKMTHTKDRPHKCPVCGKGFIQTRYLRSHLATHKDEQGFMSDEVKRIIKKAELTLNDETDEESIDSPGIADHSSSFRANDEETATAEILCSFKRGLSCSAQNSESELSPAMPSVPVQD